MRIENINISTGIVAQALQTNSHDVGTLCTHKNINKWSRHKPINFPKMGGLLESEWEGCPADKVAGIYYGLKATTDAGNISTIHSVQFEYVGRPKGGEQSPFRLGDFRGYDSEARCNLYGEYDANKEVDVDKDMMQVNIYYDEFNDTGVDINKLVPPNTVLNNIGHCYPCVVIDNFIHALKNVTTGTYTPLQYNGAWQRYFKLEIDQSKPEYRLPLYPTAKRKVSFCLVERLYHTDGTYDFRSWLNVTNLVDNTNCIAIPDATGLLIQFMHHLPPVIPQSAYGDLRGFTLVFENHMEQGKAYSIPVKVRDTASGVEKTYTIYKDAIDLPSETVSVYGSWNDFGIYPLNGDIISLSVIVDYENMVASKTFNIQL